MSKETTIIFVYDTELLKREEDDPNSAILYFYPTWVSDQQKTALCGQLIGSVLCLKSFLALPKAVSLQTGKFFLIENGRYILVVGTDRNIPDWVLDHRATILYSLLRFFHKDFTTLGRMYENENLTIKLYHIFDTYLKLMFLGGCIFSHMPLWDLSKTETDLTIKAKILLEKCKNILGGLLLWHNKVLYTQLSAQTSKKIAFADPFRIKNPAELTDLNFDPPPGVKLLQVYIPCDEYKNLSGNLIQDCHQTLKQDTSLLFTSVPEDETFSPGKQTTNNCKKNKRSRPNSLNLKSCSLDSPVGSRKTPVSPYWKQSSSVCTPMNETKSFVPGIIDNKKKDNFWDISVGFHKMNVSQNSRQEICTRQLEKAERLFSFIQTNLDKRSMDHSSSLGNIVQTNSILNPFSQYSNRKSINLKRCKTIHDPLFPWSKGNSMAASQYYVQDVLDNKKSYCIVERKKSLTLPIKPHNASEAQKSPGGYCTPLMNRLSRSYSFERQRPLNVCFLSRPENKTEDDSNVQKCILFMYGERDLVLAALLTEGCIRDGSIIETLYHLCMKEMPTLENEIKSSVTLSQPATSSELDPYSILSVDADWDTLKRTGLWEASDLTDLTRLHGNFKKHKDINDIYLRKLDSVLFGKREGATEVFYHEPAPVNMGLLPPNDAMGTVHQTAKKRLEKYHDVFIN